MTAIRTRAQVKKLLRDLRACTQRDACRAEVLRLYDQK